MAAFDYMNSIGVLLFVLGLILGLAWLAKRAGFASFIGMHPKAGKTRRLAIKEVLALDARHRLVLVQRDNREHLILIGPQTQTVIETDIELSLSEALQASEAKNEAEQE